MDDTSSLQDRHSLLIEDDAVSPRLALSYHVPGANLLLRASYDRIFQPPATESLLSSEAAEMGVHGVEESVPAPAGGAHFFEVGFRKPFWNAFRIGASHYRRTFRNYVDDTLLPDLQPP